jgi:hypothetical protein
MWKNPLDFLEPGRGWCGAGEDFQTRDGVKGIPARKEKKGRSKWAAFTWIFLKWGNGSWAMGEGGEFKNPFTSSS